MNMGVKRSSMISGMQHCASKILEIGVDIENWKIMIIKKKETILDIFFFNFYMKKHLIFFVVLYSCFNLKLLIANYKLSLCVWLPPASAGQ